MVSWGRTPPAWASAQRQLDLHPVDPDRGALAEAGAATDPGRAVATASLLALLVGGILAGAGLLRLGFLADFISSPVLAGFRAGMGLFIAASQLDKVLGVPVEGDDFFAKVCSALGQLGDANLATGGGRRCRGA
jgi:sulfate permease, SulP family